jgi:hypothetical protein
MTLLSIIVALFHVIFREQKPVIVIACKHAKILKRLCVLHVHAWIGEKNNSATTVYTYMEGKTKSTINYFDS